MQNWPDERIQTELDKLTKGIVAEEDARTLVHSVRDDYTDQLTAKDADLELLKQQNDGLFEQVNELQADKTSLITQVQDLSPDVTVIYTSVQTGTSQFEIGITDADNKDLLYANATARATAISNLQGVIDIQQNHLLNWGKSDPWDWNGIGTKPPFPTNWGGLDSCMNNAVQIGGRRALNLQCISWFLRGEWQQDGTTKAHTVNEKFSDTGILRTDRIEDYKVLVRSAALRYLIAPYSVRTIVTGTEYHGGFLGRDTNNKPTFNHYRFDDYPGTAGASSDMGIAYIHNLSVATVLEAAATLKIDPAEFSFINNYPPLIWWGKPASYTVQPGHPLYNRPYGTADARSLEALVKMISLCTRVDVIAFDMSTGNKDGIYPANDPWLNLQRYDDTLFYLQSLFPGKKLLMAETYDKDPLHANVTPEFRAAIRADSFRRFVQGGLSGAWIWGFRGQAMNAAGQPTLCPDAALITDTSVATGGQGTLMLEVVRMFKDYFGPGTPLMAAVVDGEGVSTLASPTKTMLISQVNSPLKIKLNNDILKLNPYQVRVV